MRNWNPVTISITNDQLSAIDELRKDVSRSRFIQRIIQNYLESGVKELNESRCGTAKIPRTKLRK
jgi:metal-responsive CopG/Arc/MetJ family transcriptional regulator